MTIALFGAKHSGGAYSLPETMQARRQCDIAQKLMLSGVN